MKSSSKNLSPLELLPGEASILDAIRLARTNAVGKETNLVVRRMAGDTLSREIPTRRPVRQLLLFIGDMVERGTPEEYALAIADRLKDEIRAMYEAKESSDVDFNTAHLREEEAEAEEDIAEARFAIERSGPALQRLELATKKRELRAKVQVLAARREVYGARA